MDGENKAFSLTAKLPIEAETNLANPSEFMEAEAFASVEAAPPIVAGVLILLTVNVELIVAAAPMISLLFFGSK